MCFLVVAFLFALLSAHVILRPYLITPNLKPGSESGLFVYTQLGPNRIWICGSVKLLPGADLMDSRWRQLGGNVWKLFQIQISFSVIKQDLNIVQKPTLKWIPYIL